MIHYSSAIIFDSTTTKILLILKNRPKWQKGLWNFPGGHIEDGEFPGVTISREIKEECGLLIDPMSYKELITEERKEVYDLRLFLSRCTKPQEKKVKTETDEEVKWFDIDNLPSNIVSDVKWMIYFALTFFESNKPSRPYFCKIYTL